MDEVSEEVSLFKDEEPAQADQAVEEEVAPVEEAPTFQIPEKFAGKSMEEVVESYVNLEKEAGRRANEVGELRKLTDQILKQQVESKPAEQIETQINEDIGFDDFIDDPAKAVDRAISKNPRLKALEDSLYTQNAEVAHKRMLERHPDADEVVASTAFLAWVNESPSRMQRMQEANVNLDIDLASDMLSLYKQTKKVSTEEAITERDTVAKADLKKATVETGRVPADTKPIYRRAELIRLKIENPTKYAAMSEDIHQAYADGRVKQEI